MNIKFVFHQKDYWLGKAKRSLKYSRDILTQEVATIHTDNPYSTVKTFLFHEFQKYLFRRTT